MRYNQKKIYTSIGPDILIAVNPYEDPGKIKTEEGEYGIVLSLKSCY